MEIGKGLSSCIAATHLGLSVCRHLARGAFICGVEIGRDVSYCIKAIHLDLSGRSLRPEVLLSVLWKWGWICHTV